MSKSAAATALEQAQIALNARRLPLALLLFDEAEDAGANPDQCGGGRWQAAMLAGDFQTAWRESDAIRARGAADEHRFWTGEPLAGKRVIVRCLHGLGDAVQMLRYAPALNALAAHVMWEVPPRLLELASHFAGVQHVVTWGEAAPAEPPAYDLQVEVMELPYLFRTRAQDLPLATEYLKVAQRVYEKPPLPRVGLVWAGSDWNLQRGVDPAELAPLLALHQVEWVPLQHGEAGAPATVLALAETIAALDLVITVDTLAAHLAGALGKPVWLLLQHAADWRWMHARADSPWYPTMCIFRQRAAGDWANVVKQVAKQIAKELEHGFLGV